MSKGRAKAPSQRQLRVGEELRHILAQVLKRGKLHDPAVQDTPITVTEVRASPDLKNVTTFVVPLGGDAAVTDRVLEGLNRAAPFLRRVLAEKVRLRHTPRINFLAASFSPIASMLAGFGPTQISPASITDWAKPAFSLRKP